MNLSLNEVAALAKKATRGAGFAWGEAEDTSRAIIWLHARGQDGIAMLADYLTQDHTNIGGPTPDWTPTRDILCPIRTAIALSDHAAQQSGTRTLSHLASPALMAPLLAHFACASQINATTVTLHFTPDTSPATQPRATTTPAAYDTLITLAARTYAPATEASRRLGAGTGLSDND